MNRSRYFWTTLSIVLVFGVVAGTSCFLGLRMASLHQHGVSARAKVTDLKIVRSSSQGSRSVNYRVWMKIEDGALSKSLSGDTDQATWQALSVGASVPVVYLPNEENVCMIGEPGDAERVHQRAKWVSIISCVLMVGLVGIIQSFAYAAGH